MSLRHPLRRRSGGRHHPIVAGVAFAAIVLVGFALAFNKHHVLTDLRGGKNVAAEFPRQYLLRKWLTPVKIAGVEVGTVTGITHNAQGALVTMKLYGSNRAKLGTEPSAEIRLATLLGGDTFVQLTPGGSSGSPAGAIPVSRSGVPVYFDNLQDSITPPADHGIREFIDQNDTALAAGGTTSLRQTFADAPATLVPGGEVLNAFEGERAGDLESLIDSTAQEDTVLTAKMGQIESVVDGLGTFSSTLGAESPALAALVADLPRNEAGIDAGLTALNGTLTQLDATAAVSGPTVRNLTTLLTTSQPTLVDAAPVLANLQPFLASATPLLGQLVPTVQSTTTVLDGIEGPTLEHLNGPTTVSPDGHDIPAFVPQLVDTQQVELQRPASLYEEIGYVISGLDSAVSFYDSSGHQPEIILGNGPQNGYEVNGPSVGNSTNGTFQHGTGCGAETCPSTFTPITQYSNGILPVTDGVTP